MSKRKPLPVFYKVVGFLVLFYFTIKYLVNFIMPPLPQSLVLMYLFLAIVATVLYITLFEERMKEFWQPALQFIRSNQTTTTYARWGLLVLVPFLAGMTTYQRLMPSATPPLEQRVIHPAPPREYAQLYNPLPHSPENILAGKGMFIAYCSPCHGTGLNGKGPASVGFNPPPANFVDPGTIAQLQESYLFWRISTGGVGLPVESQPWNSAMPRWETRIAPENIWRIIMYEYAGSGHTPRTWQ
ncbi:MAG TPA: cytochrome c [Nitrospiria bacterium]|nr:cytochrome c [Nitrospiria bacterium]